MKPNKPKQSSDKSKPIWETIKELSESLPDEFWDEYPSDLSVNHDYYLYGGFKQYPEDESIVQDEPNPKPDYDALPARLRSDVRILGSLLGEVIADARGEAFVDTIEQIRAVAKQARTEHEGSLQSLSELLKTIEEDELVDIARAFNQFLNLANLAEQRFYTKDLEHTFVREWAGLNEQLGDQLRTVLDQVRIELVLTAHPHGSTASNVDSQIRCHGGRIGPTSRRRRRH